MKNPYLRAYEAARTAAIESERAREALERRLEHLKPYSEPAPDRDRNGLRVRSPDAKV